METKLIQCTFCGRSGDGIIVDSEHSCMTCNYCGKTFSLKTADRSLEQLKRWRDEEVNNCRILLIDAIRFPSLNTEEFINLVRDRAYAVSEKCGGDFLASACIKIISTEKGASGQRESGRTDILADIKNKCDKFPQDILGLILFIRRMNKSWPCYQEGLDDLCGAAEKFGIQIPLDMDHSEETELPPAEVEERAIYSQDVSKEDKMGNLTLESIVLEDNVTKIGESAFDGCENITQVELGRVREIGGSAFCGCKGIQKIIIPNSVRMIGACAFRGCGLTEAVFEETDGWHAVSFGGKEVEISAVVLANETRAAMLLKKFVNCSWYRKS